MKEFWSAIGTIVVLGALMLSLTNSLESRIGGRLDRVGERLGRVETTLKQVSADLYGLRGELKGRDLIAAREENDGSKN